MFADQRPTADVVESLYQKTLSFWTEAINNVPVYREIFVEKTKSVSDYRSKDGGSMLLRPVGIEILAEAYTNWFEEKGTEVGFWSRFIQIVDALNGIHWNYVLWDDLSQTMAKSISSKFTREYAKYLLGMEHEHDYIMEGYTKLRGEKESTLIPLPEKP